MFFSLTCLAQEITDTLKLKSDTALIGKKVEPKEKHFQYFRLGVDVSKLIRSGLTKDYSTAEFLIESVWEPKMHYVIESGFATSKTNETNVIYSSSSYFLRFGFDKYFFGKLFEEDMDNAFIGLRLAGARNKRQEAVATLWDPFYGNTTVVQPAASQMMYWIELTTGFRMELQKNIFIGWNIRGKTFLNPKKIEELTPKYLAGYGVAKKQPGFGYSFYLLYGFGKR